MSHEQTPRTYTPPLEFHTTFKVNREAHEQAAHMYIHSLGHFALTNEIGPGGSSSYVTVDYEDKAKVYRKLATNKNEGPEFRVIRKHDQVPKGGIKGYHRIYNGLISGVWVEGYASGKQIKEEFVFKSKYHDDEDYEDRLLNIVESTNAAVAAQMAEDFNQQDNDLAA